MFSLVNCGGFKKVDSRKVPVNAQERARKNVEEGRGASVNSILRGARGGTTYEFSTSNPLWRASLETLDFLPMTTVDYSGGMIISDWYAENNKDESIKISIRFLSNEVRSDSLKVIVHKRTCSTNQNCKVSLLNSSKISQELLSTIIRKAALIEKESKKKK
tara:strand:- start:2541 stop:3023 length:483 start_codon:yes stop_codon:yes gene_type:complete